MVIVEPFGNGHVYDLSGGATFNGHAINNAGGRDILVIAWL